MEAENAALKARVDELEKRVAALENKKTRSAKEKESKELGAIDKLVVNWALIPKGNLLQFTVAKGKVVIAVEHASFQASNHVVPKDVKLIPAGAEKQFFSSINAWATAVLKKYMEALGRKSASVNVYDKKSGIAFQSSSGEYVALNTIQSIVRVAPAAAMGGGGAQPAAAAPTPASNPAAGGGGAQPAAEAEAMDIPASQESQVGDKCWRCDNFVAEGEECECEHIACKCGHIVEEKNYLGECVGCEKDLCTSCGALTEDQEPICHPCSKLLESEEPDVGIMDVNGLECLFNPETGDVNLKKADGLPGDKISTYKEGKHQWVWAQKKIGDTFYKVNHFNYVMQTASAGGKWVGIYNPATKALTETPAPEDF